MLDFLHNPDEIPNFVIVGLGNPGHRFENTRRNIGFDLLDYLTKYSPESIYWNKRIHWSYTDRNLIEGYFVMYAKPQVFVNNSGMPVDDIMQRFKLKSDRLIVIFEDPTLNVGCYKIEKGGNPQPHSGINSIIQHLATTDFVRIRIGVGMNPEDEPLNVYLLSQIPENEYVAISSRYHEIYDFLTYYFYYDFDECMRIFNAYGSETERD